MIRRQPGNFTATARAIDAAESHAALSGFVQVLRDGLDAALALMASWTGLPDTSVGQLSISRQFPIGDGQASEADLLLRARLAGEISKAAFLAEITWRGILAVPTDSGGAPAAFDGDGPSDETVPGGAVARSRQPHQADS